MPLGNGVGKFQRPAAEGGAKAAAPQKFSFKGIQSQQPRAKFLGRGKYRLRFLSWEWTKTGNFRGFFEVVAVHEAGGDASTVGETVAVMQPVGGRAVFVAMPILKRMFMCIAGYGTDEEYDAFDPNDEFMDACGGVVNEMSKQGINGAGRLVDAVVTKGNDIPPDEKNPEGDYYRNIAWYPVPDEEQDA